MQVTRTADLKEYCKFMRENAAEAQSLLNDLLISVTKFFRDAEAFDVLAKKILPEIFKAKLHGEPIRVWVPGCATGEEAYSLAMLLIEEAARQEQASADTDFRLGPGFPRPRRSAGGTLPDRDRKRRRAKTGCIDSSRGKAIITTSGRNCVTSSCSPCTTY